MLHTHTCSYVCVKGCFQIQLDLALAKKPEREGKGERRRRRISLERTQFG